MMIPQIDIAELSYDLPEDRIAIHPLAKRDESKLMVVHAQSEASWEHKHFYEIPSIIPPHSLMIVNSSKVIRARLYAVKDSGGKAEILLVDPTNKAAADAMMSKEKSTWHCLLGGKRIIPGTLLTIPQSICELKAEVLERNGTQGIIELSWNGNATLSSVLDEIGTIPLPPYLNRQAEESDSERYQTVYAKTEGSVAAPTAGLHFTNEVIQGLQNNTVSIQEVTLHVGLGTFKPFEETSVQDFAMHQERISVEKSLIESCRSFFMKEQRGTFICVGTTSCRTMESLYWFGIALLDEDCPAWNDGEFFMGQWDAYRLFDRQQSPAVAFDAILRWMDHHGYTCINGETRMMIIPGYHFGVTEALITNFHQPKSTLLFLVSAFMGIETWKKTYSIALEHHYRFLSYGDSSIIFR